MTKLVNEIKSMIEEEENDTLKKNVLKYIIDEHKNDNDIKSFFRNLYQGGCQCGMVNTLIYYCDTHKFYDKYYDEIEELRLELENDLGEPLKIGSDLKNWFAWLAFEETARKLADELGLEI